MTSRRSALPLSNSSQQAKGSAGAVALRLNSVLHRISQNRPDRVLVLRRHYDHYSFRSRGPQQFHRVAHHLSAADPMQRLGDSRAHPPSLARCHNHAGQAHNHTLRRPGLAPQPQVDYNPERGQGPHCR